MAKKTVGYVRLEWTCPNCGTRNPGPEKLCTRCGAPQPPDVKFEQPAQETLITDAAELEKAKQGPDIHCAFCGTRNPAGAKVCSRCGAPLGEGKARETGAVVGAFQSEAAPELTCPACGTKNPAMATVCAQCGAALAKPKVRAPIPTKVGTGRGFGIAAIGCLTIVLIGIIAFVYLGSRTNQVTGYVHEVGWTRSIAILGQVAVNHEGWKADIPTGATVGTCSQKLHHTQDEPEAGAKEVCGTPYTVDKGSGYAEVVQDCQYQVYADWCRYTAQEWQVVDRAVASGFDLNPQWPEPQLGFNQQLGDRQESQRVVFETDGREYEYAANSYEFSQFAVGSKWELKVNRLGRVTALSPAD